MNFLKKISKIFFGPKKKNFGLGGAILGTPNPQESWNLKFWPINIIFLQNLG